MTDRLMLKCGCAANSQVSRMGGRSFDPPVPGCVVHDCIEPADKAPDLSGRQSKCCGRSIVPSSTNLPFFEYRGEGSPAATERCKCGYAAAAHAKPRPAHLRHVCDEFTPHGPWDYDLHYCGHGGWD